MPATVFDYRRVAAAAKGALQEAFSDSLIETEEGFAGRVHIKIVSPKFNGKNEKRKQNMVWEVLKAELEPEDLAGVSLVMPYGMDDLP